MQNNIDTLITLTTKIAKLMHQQTQMSYEERAATILQTQTLSFLEEQPNAKISDVANYMHASLSSTTQMIERMVQAGLVARTHDDQDRRVIHLTVTKDGLTKLRQMKEAKRARMQKLFSGIDQNDIKDLIRIQQKIVQSLEEKA